MVTTWFETFFGATLGDGILFVLFMTSIFVLVAIFSTIVDKANGI